MSIVLWKACKCVCVCSLVGDANNNSSSSPLADCSANDTRLELAFENYIKGCYVNSTNNCQHKYRYLSDMREKLTLCTGDGFQFSLANNEILFLFADLRVEKNALIFRVRGSLVSLINRCANSFNRSLIEFLASP